MNRATIQVLGLVSASHTGSGGWKDLTGYLSHSRTKEVVGNLLRITEVQWRILARQWQHFFQWRGISPENPRGGCQVFWGDLRISGLTKLRGQSKWYLYGFQQLWELHSDISFYLGKQLQWKIAQTHSRICPYAWYFVSDISVTLQRT